jgi:hypothetical protein
MSPRTSWVLPPTRSRRRVRRPSGCEERAGRLECRWQRERLPDAIRDLVLDDQRLRNDICWSVFDSGLSLEQAEAPHEAETLLRVRDPGTANALALWFRAELAPGTSLSVGPADTPTHWGMTTAPLRSRVELAADMVVRAKVRTAPVRSIGTLTRWAIAMPGADWEEHDERSIWGEIDD